MTKKNFNWLANDIDSSLVVKVICKKNNESQDYGVYNVKDVLDVTGDKLEVETANIDDLTNLLTIGIVRFINIIDNSDIIDVPFRNLYKLYQNSNHLGNEYDGRLISFKELDIFSIIDEVMRDDLFIVSSIITDVSDDLNSVMKIASEFGSYSMQEKFDALNDITLINHRRLIIDDKEENGY